jgi:DNA polymerase-3 subunit gamma/tau
MASLLQEMAVVQAVPGAGESDDPDVADAIRLGALLPADETQLLYSIVLAGRAELPLAPDEYSGLVMVLLRMLAFAPARPMARRWRRVRRALRRHAPHRPVLRGASRRSQRRSLPRRSLHPPRLRSCRVPRSIEVA